MALSEQGRYPEAIAALKQAIVLQANFAEAYDTLGYLYYKSGQLEKAVESLKQAISISPDCAEAQHHLGITLFYRRRYHEAVEFLLRATRLKPDYSQAHFNLGVAFAALKQRAAAMETYKSLRALDALLAKRLLAEIFKDKLVVVRRK